MKMMLLISGHGAGDVGAIGCGYRENLLAIELVDLIRDHLKHYANVVIYPHNQNAYRDLKNGKFFIDKYDYVLEVHFNASNGKGRGSECYVTTRENGISVEQAIMKNMSKYFKLRDNDSIFDGVKRTNFAVINKVKSLGMSGALLETCFIDNQKDMNIYQANKNDIAKGIAEGIAKGFGLVKSQPTQNVASNKKPEKSIDDLAKEVIDGKHGTGEARKQSLGDKYAEVQVRVNEILTGKPTTAKKSNKEIAREVLLGLWGNGADRRNRLTKAGYDYSAIQKEVNKMLK